MFAACSGARSPRAIQRRNAAHVAQLFRWWDERKIAPRISATYPLERARRRDHRARRAKGRRQAGGHPLKLSELRGSRGLRTIFWAATCFAFVMAVLPHPPQLPGEPNDKVQHIIAFATLAALGSSAYFSTSIVRLSVGLSLFGALIEVVQAIPALHRDSDVMDWIADTAAVLVVLMLVRWWRS